MGHGSWFCVAVNGRYTCLATSRGSVRRYRWTHHFRRSTSTTSCATWRIVYRYRLSTGSARDSAVKLLLLVSSAVRCVHDHSSQILSTGGVGSRFLSITSGRVTLGG